MVKSTTGLRAWVAGAFFMVFSLVAASALASVPALVLVFGPPGTQRLSAPAQGQSGSVDSIKLTLNQNGNGAFGARLDTLGLSGTDAADFAIVPGGTCVPGTTFLFPITSTTGSTCLVNVRYTPSTPAEESAFLTASCETVGVAGGFSIACNTAVGTVASLVGSILAPVPALSPATLTALALSLFALGSFAALRRAKPGRR